MASSEVKVSFSEEPPRSTKSSNSSCGIPVGSGSSREASGGSRSTTSNNRDTSGVQGTSSKSESSFGRALKRAATSAASGRSPMAKTVRRVCTAASRGGEEASKIAGDFGKLKEAMEPMEQFFFMRNDARPVHGLQNWSLDEWTFFLTKLKLPAKELAAQLKLTAPLDGDMDFHALAVEVKERIGEQLPISQWRAVWHFQNEALNEAHDGSEANMYYMRSELLSNMLFDRDFPLGVEEKIIRDRHTHAIAHSGLHRVGHVHNEAVSCIVYTTMFGFVFGTIFYLVLTLNRKDLWTLDATLQDPTRIGMHEAIASRVKDRAQAASLIVQAYFSLCVNSALDKIGLIDPSTSTVFIGITLGGTWGFVLDNFLGTDEGFRETLWSPTGGMLYAMGTLNSGRYGRYIVALLFDMFVTVILFKALYSRLVRLAGFTVAGREWMANGFVSAFIGVITFVVYANLTRTQWAYPSGNEDVVNQWISGHAMTLATVNMNMVYLVSETRARIGEPGINDPNVKIVVTFFNFLVVYLLSRAGEIDPSMTSTERLALKDNFTAAAGIDPNLPLANVCATRAKGFRGFLIFGAVSVFCLAAVIFGTSAQSFTGLRALFCAAKPTAILTTVADESATVEDASRDAGREAASESSTSSYRQPSVRESSRRQKSGRGPSPRDAANGPNALAQTGDSAGARTVTPGRLARTNSELVRRKAVRNAAPVDKQGRAVPMRAKVTPLDRLKGQCCLFVVFFLLVWANVLVFTLVPFSRAGRERDMELVHRACPSW